MQHSPSHSSKCEYVCHEEREGIDVLEHEALMSAALCHPERQPRETTLSPSGCSSINIDYERQTHATVVKEFLVAPALTGKFRGFTISFMLM